jgi:hypothetical protein
MILFFHTQLNIKMDQHSRIGYKIRNKYRHLVDEEHDNIMKELPNHLLNMFNKINWNSFNGYRNTLTFDLDCKYCQVSPKFYDKVNKLAKEQGFNNGSVCVTKINNLGWFGKSKKNVYHFEFESIY